MEFRWNSGMKNTSKVTALIPPRRASRCRGEGAVSARPSRREVPRLGRHGGRSASAGRLRDRPRRFDICHSRPGSDRKREEEVSTEAQVKKSKAKRKPAGKMTTSELAEATAAYGREMAIDEFRPMDSQSRARWERAKRKVGRPRRGVPAFSCERTRRGLRPSP